MIRTAFIGIETFDLPTDILEHESHLEGGVARLEVRADIRADSERGVGLVDGVNGFERHSDFEKRAELARIHDINEDIARTESTSGDVAVFVRITHTTIVEVMKTDRKIIGFVGFAISFVRFLDGRASEVMSV